MKISIASMSTAQQSAADKAIADRDRQYRLYRAQKRAERAEMYRDPEHGDALHKFEATLQHFRGLDEADDMLAYVRKQLRLWLRAAPEGFRFTALQLISERIQLIRIHAGLAPLDDPLGEEDDNVYRICKRELGL